MHALFKDEVECKMTHVRADYFLCAFRSSNPTIEVVLKDDLLGIRRRHRIPAIYESWESVEAGGLEPASTCGNSENPDEWHARRAAVTSCKRCAPAMAITPSMSRHWPIE
jgi:hypothetical protein